MITVSIEGLDKIKKALDPSEFKERVDSGLWESSEVLMNTVKGNMPDISGFGSKGIPVDTGRLKGSVDRRRIQMMAAEVYAGTNYSKFVHDGTKRMAGRPFFEWALQDYGALKKMEKVLIEHVGSGLRLRVV